MRTAELEKKLIDQNITVMKYRDEKERLVDKMQEIKTKYNEMIQNKSDLQSDLIMSEEEKLKVSKALIEL